MQIVITHAQEVQVGRIVGQISDGKSGEKLPFGTVRLCVGNTLFRGVATDDEGRYDIGRVPMGRYVIIADYMGYDSQRMEIEIASDKEIRKDFALWQSEHAIEEVTITAKERDGSTAETVIGQTAMEHLQPSSLSDLMSLLPGGQTTTPATNTVNAIRLREVGTTNTDYDITSLGTKVLIDDNVIGTDANLQAMPDATSGDADETRTSVGKGVDMRTIPTDNIEKVEVVRGIPSVQYGDLSSGLVRIERKSGALPLTARLKADQYGRLISVGKGFLGRKGWTINTDADLFASNADPRNKMEKYTRINTSVRLQKTYRTRKENTLKLNLNADYSGNIDNVKTDPEVMINTEDKYKSAYHKGAVGGRVLLTSEDKKLTINYNVSLSADEMRQTRRVTLSRDTYVPILNAEGVYDAEVLPCKYTAEYRVSGRPFYSNLKVCGGMQKTTGIVDHNITVGGEWQYNKNYGRGQIYDPRRPLHGTTGHVPRSFRSMMPTSILGLWAENELTTRAGRAIISMQIGLRTSQMTNLPSRYAMSGHVYADPRGNIKVSLPVGTNASIYVSGGMGRMCKMPTIANLNPDVVYYDLQELNYWHENPEYRRVVVHTFVLNRDAYELSPAHNKKYEVRIGGKMKSYTMSATLFHERMTDGFRSVAEPVRFIYERYDSRSAGTLDYKPMDLSVFTHQTDTILSTVSHTANGSLIDKKGVEWQMTSPRIPTINMRLSIVGAWLKTKYSNAEAEWYAGVSKVIMGKAVNDKYIGLYDWDYGSVRSKTTMNVTADTYIDRLGFIFSVTAEIFMHGEVRTALRNAKPIAYYDTQGNVVPYSDESLKNPMLAALVLSNTQEDITTEERAYANFHFKATKQFGSYATISFFADRVLNAARDYESEGFTIRRVFTPYFGAQINMKI